MIMAKDNATERRPVVGYEGLYEVSSDGEMFRVKKCKNTWAGRKLKPTLDRRGYLYVNLSHNGVKKTHKVHRIVLQSFKPNPDHLPQTNHINGIKTDNREENLDWCDGSQNQLHARRQLGKVCGPPKRPVRGTNIHTGAVVEMESTRAATRFVNGSDGSICLACQGKRKQAYGYRWEYI